MAVATNTVVYDGQVYRSGETIPNLGTLVAVEVDGLIRSYRGMSADESKLPHMLARAALALWQTQETCTFSRTGSGTRPSQRNNP